MLRFSLIRQIVVSVSLGAALAAQVASSQDLPVKNWAAPLYWQPSQAEIETSPMRAEIRTPTPDATTPVGSLVFVAMTPCRVVDTRNNCTLNPALCTNAQFGPPSLSTNTTRSFPIQLSPTCPVPANAMAYSFNVTMIPNPQGSFAGYVTVWNTAASPNTPPPAATILDFPTADIRSNAAIVPAGISNGSVSVITNATNPLDVTFDINGYYAPLTGITLAQGTVGAPSLSFSGDAGTGIFSSGAGMLNLATGGMSRLTLRSDGDLDLAGSLRKSGTLFLHDLGTGNVGVGLSALATSTGTYNTASGFQALISNTYGGANTATGAQALYSNSSGSDNTASGSSALFSNTTGAGNTASGLSALRSNTTGNNNTACGAEALESNTTGNLNTATGVAALPQNTSGDHNTASGSFALAENITGGYNTADGVFALYINTIGNNNTAVGYNAGYNITGSNNTTVGSQAGYNVTGSNNIDIGNQGTSGDSGVIRIGTSGTHTLFFAAGIQGVTPSQPNPVPVLIDSNGQLGTINSSRRYKEDIQDMNDASSGLLRLRPVTYRYQKPYADGSKPIDYGLIAEEVAEVYPDLVVKDADGQIQTVQYQKLTPMLLNELQKEHEKLGSLEERFSALQKECEALRKTLESLTAEKGNSTKQP